MKPLMPETNEIEFRLFQKASAFESWFHTVKNDLLVVTDFHLDGEAEDGLDLMERLGLGDKSLVFTSAPEDETLVTKARHLGVRSSAKMSSLHCHRAYHHRNITLN
jgi:hypothetical protein